MLVSSFQQDRRNAYAMADLADVILQYVDKHGQFDTLKLAAELKEDHQKIVGAVKSVQSLGEVRIFFRSFINHYRHT